MTVLKKIRGKIKSIASLRLLKLAVSANWPRLAAYILGKVAWRVPEKPRPGVPRVLALGRTIFNDDVKALAKYSGQIEYAVVHLQYFEQIFQHFFSKQQLAAMSELNYHVDRTTIPAKNRLAHFWRRLLPLLKKNLGIHAVMTGNFAYVVQQELQTVCEEQYMPFFVLHKEGFVSFGGPEYASEYVSGYKNSPFVGTRIFFYNESAKATFLNAGIPGFTEDKMEVVGVPRLDSYFVKGQEVIDRRQIVLFSFYVRDRFHYLENDHVVMEKISKRAEDFHRWVIEFAIRHPEFRVVIKTKSAAQYFQYVQSIRHQAGADNLTNLIVTNADSAERLIKSSQIVLGSNSTTMVEALIIGKQVVVADFSDLLPKDSQDFLGNYQDLVNIARSSLDVEKQVMGSAAGFSRTRLEDFLQEFIYRGDGQASQRVEQSILKELRLNY